MLKITQPTWYHKTIYDIDFYKLWEKGFRNILCDLDNTLTAFFNKIPDEKVKNLIDKIRKIGFNFFVISNNRKKRVNMFCEPLDVNGSLYRASKPSVLRLSLFMKKNMIYPDETIVIGDQIMTDVILANRLDVASILIEPVADQDLIVTKINRSFDHKIRKKLRETGKLKGVE